MIDLNGMYEVKEVQVYPNQQGSDSKFTLADDEILLDTAARSRAGQMSQTLVLYVAVPTTADQCMAVTSGGTRCQRDAVEDSNYCGLESHGPEESDEPDGYTMESDDK